MIVCDPLKARFWFKWREPITLAISAGSFVGLFFVLKSFLGAGTAIVVAVVVTYFAKFHWLDLLVLGIKCPNPKCGELIEVCTPWVCGYKVDGVEHQNPNTGEYPFIHECEHCHKTPKAYACHHCAEPVYLSADKDKQNCARRLVAFETKTGSGEERIAKQQEKIQELEHNYEVAKLEKKIAAEKTLSEKPEEHSQEKEIEAAMTAISKEVVLNFTVEEAATRLLAKSAEKYKDDAFQKSRWDLAIQAAASKHKLKMLKEGK